MPDEHSADRDGSRSLYRLPRIVVSSAVALITVTVGFVSLPSQVYAPRGWNEAIQSVQSVIPQGWAFFTRDPREATVIPFTESGGGWVNVNRGPNAQPEYAFGMNRESRLTEFDTEGISAAAGDDVEWFECSSFDHSECIEEAEGEREPVEVSTSGWDLRLCGPVALVKEEPVPLSFGRLGGQPELSAILFDVECESAE